MSAADAVAYVLQYAGAIPRDELDNFVVNVVRSFGTQGTLYRHQEDTGISNGVMACYD